MQWYNLGQTTKKTLYNMVGFQTKMKYGSQIDVFRKIPGLENVQFARLGGIHRNTFINTPKLLSDELSLKNQTNIYFAGQITGVEGYVESTAIGLLVAFFIDKKISKNNIFHPPLQLLLEVFTIIYYLKMNL